MLVNLLIWIVLVAIAVLFGWLVSRAWRAKNVVLRWGGVVLSGLLTIVMALVVGVTGRGLYLLYTPKAKPDVQFTLASSPERIARGEHLARTVCAACHTVSGDVPLSGGKNLAEDTGLPLGTIYPPNLTPAGPVAQLSDADIVRIIRYGVMPDGRRTFMPWNRLKHLSDEDLQSVIAYVRSQPAVEHVTPIPFTNPSLLAAAFVGANMIQIDFEPVTGSVSAPPKAANATYGEYIVSYNDCRDCHGANLDGSTRPPAPKGPNLRVVQGWTQEQFMNTLRTGVDPSGHALQPPMPWQMYSRMDDVELGAVYAYLQTLPPVGQ